MEGLKGQLTNRWRLILFGLMPLVSLLMHVHIFPQELKGVHAWRQCETGSNVLRFAREGMKVTEPHVYSLEWDEGYKRMEFPVMQWGMAAAYKVFGEHVIWMRLISWLIGLVGVFGMFALTFSLFRDCFTALATAWAYSFSPVFFYYTVNPLPDNLALAAGIWGLASYVKYCHTGDTRRLWLSAGMMMLAVLAKLPFVLFLAFPGVHLLVELVRSRLGSWGGFLRGALAYGVSMVLPGVWYLTVIPTWHGNGVVKGIFESSADELPYLMEILVHNVVSTLPELLVNYGSVAFLLGGIFFLFKARGYRNGFFLPFVGLFLAVMAYFLFELNMIGKAHDYYLFPFLPGIFLLVGYGIRGLVRLPARAVFFLVVGLLLYLPIGAGLRTYARWSKTGFPEDLISQAGALRAAIPENAKVVAGHDLSPHIYLYHLQRRGWTVSKDAVNVEKLEACIDKGAKYLVSSHRELDGQEVLKPYLGPLEKEVGVFRIYSLHPKD